jgi:hypothetical protein
MRCSVQIRRARKRNGDEPTPRIGEGRLRDQALVDVPPSIGPVVFGTLGVGWVMVRCPHQYDELMRRAGGVWEPGARQWLVERRRIGPVIRELERTVDPLFRQAGIRLDP